jgi:hypothetical protein
MALAAFSAGAVHPKAAKMMGWQRVEVEAAVRAIPLARKVPPHAHDSERFAFTARRIHGFASTGNAYDATQTDDRIASGDTLLILPEGVSAYCWPFAVTSDGQTPWRPTQGA